ncbi:Listeria-Bacteroides repeat domain [anaerobic digester metagenome]
MPVIDSRLLDCDGEPEYTENFNRVLALIDALRADMTSAQGAISSTSDALDALEALTTRTVTFDSDGGTEGVQQIVVYGGVATEPTAPTKEGYTFGGWYSGETVYDFATAVKADLTLTAHWTEEV